MRQSAVPVSRSALVVAGLVVLGLVAAGLFLWRPGATPTEAPALDEEPGIFRLHTEQMPDGGRREPYDLEHDGARLQVVFGGVGADGGAELLVRSLSGAERDFHEYTVDESVELDGARLTVIAVHDLRDRGTDVVDVRVQPAS